MTKEKVERPFLFVGCWELREMLGRSARDEQQLLEAIEEVPSDSIYYHTHSFFLRHKYIAGPYPNDFATWAAIQVRDRVLGEKLGIHDGIQVVGAFRGKHTFLVAGLPCREKHCVAVRLKPRP